MGLLCFDLDGTLVDPLLGVHRCVARLAAEFGCPPPDPATVGSWLGYGLKEGLATLPGLQDPERLDRALDRYAQLYETQGLYEHEVYPGVHLLLARLKRQGHRIYIVSAKPATYAKRITFHFDLNLIFDEIYGSELKAAWQPKTEVLARLHDQGTVWPGGYFIGDRADDMLAARDHGLHAVGVGYGYGSREELRAAGAEVVLDSVPDLDAWLQGRLGDPEFHTPFTRAE